MLKSTWLGSEKTGVVWLIQTIKGCVLWPQVEHLGNSKGWWNGAGAFLERTVSLGFCGNYRGGFSTQSWGFVLRSCHASVSSCQLSVFAEQMQVEPLMTAVGWELLPRRRREKHPLRVLTSAHHRYKWTIKLMEPGGQSTCSANIFTKLSGSQLQEIPLHHAEQYLILSSSAEADQKDQAGGLLRIYMSNRYNNLHSRKLSKHEPF